MPRRSFIGTAGLAFHVINRGVRRSTLFESDGDYAAFMGVLCEAHERTPVRLLDLVVMKNHWHLVVWPRTDTDLTRYVGWLSLTHACRWQRVHGTRGTGPVYQGRFKAIPIQTTDYLLTVCRYVERNPVRAGVVPRARHWPWSSVSEHPGAPLPPLHDWPVPRPGNWATIVDGPESQDRLDALRSCISRSAPFGDDNWRADIAGRLRWSTGIRPVGRPPRQSLRE